MDNEGVKEIAELADRAREVEIVSVTEGSVREAAIPLFAIPIAGGGVNLVSAKAFLDPWRTAPERLKGTAKAGTLASFVDLINRHKDGGSALFGNLDVDRPSFSAVIDYHDLDHNPRFQEHRIVYDFPLSKEWKAWRGQNGTAMSQSSWAAFIEEHVADLASPYDAEAAEYERLFQTKFAAPSELITMSRGMQISVEARVKEVRTLQSGESEVVYEEVHKDGSGQKLVVPGLFIVNIPLFVGGEKSRIIVRLRYRRQESKIVWFYQMYRDDLVVRFHLEEAFAKVAEETALPSFEATPEV